MQNLCKFYSKSTKKCYFSVIFLGRFWLCFVLSDRALVRASKLLHRILKFIKLCKIYANLFKINEKNATSLSFLSRFLILFCFYQIGLGAGFKIFYTEFWNSLFMQIYAKFIQNQWKNATFSVIFLADFWFCLFYLMVRASKLLHRILRFITYANLCKIYSKSMKNATSLSFSWPIFWFRLFLSDRAWCGHQKLLHRIVKIH